MKILYIGHTYTIHANQAKIAALARLKDVEVTLVTPERWKGPLYDHKTDPYKSEGTERVAHHILKSVFAGKESAYFFRDKIFSIIANLQPDILHVEQGAYAMSYAQALLGTRKFSPETRTTFFTWWNLPYRLTGIRSILEDFNLQHSSCAIAGNNDGRGILICRGFDKPINVIPQLGVDPSVFNVARDEDMRARLGLKKFVLGYVGRVTKEKGVLDIMDAIASMQAKQELQLYVVGDGPALEEMKARAAKDGIDLIHHSAVRNEEIPKHLAQLDTLVLPSRTSEEWVEQFGHILIEAMAAGVPVLGSSSGEIPHVIQHAGRIFPEGNVEALSKLLDDFVRYPRIREQLKELGYERVQAEFTHDRIAERQLAVYDWMMTKGETIAELSQKARTKNFGNVKRMEGVSAA
jgi:L-malate glycosyltransferase